MSPTTKQMLVTVEKMNLPELDEFLMQVLELSAKRRAPRLSPIESELLLRINRGVPRTIADRANQLNEKRRIGQLSHEEHCELLALRSD